MRIFSRSEISRVPIPGIRGSRLPDATQPNQTINFPIMRSYAVALLAGLIVAVVADEINEGKWIKMDYKPILKSPRLVGVYKQCIVGEKTTGCPPEAMEMKRIIPEALETICAKCSAAFVAKLKEFFSETCVAYPELSKEMISHFDPDNKLRPAFEAKHGQLAAGCV